MRYLWLTSFAMVAIGALLIAGKAAGFFETVALVAGMLLIWSGVVKVIVLRIWRSSLKLPGATEGRSAPSKPVIGQPT